MSLAFFIALLSVTLFALSLYERRAKAAPTWLAKVIRVVSMAILGLAAFYFFDRFTS